MIIVERIEGRELEKRYSSTGMMVKQIETDTLYSEAVDIIPCPFIYEETDIPIDDEPLEAQEVLDVIFGGRE